MEHLLMGVAQEGLLGCLIVSNIRAICVIPLWVVLITRMQ